MENWADIVGFEDFYQVSDLGRVRSKDRVTFGKNRSTRVTKGLILKPKRNPSGYLQVALSVEGKVRYRYIHRLVALAFLGEPEPGQEVCHSDGVRDNNHVGNLRWGTRSENHADKNLHGTMGRYNLTKTHCPQNHPYSGDNLRIGKHGARICRECSRMHARAYYHRVVKIARMED